ncbi:thiolase family protein [Blastococcus tunisiensis]|uniref:propanoyl-CoA C-acyltransferase n=1 Tax=Blastococcus tunisiensis TaxID=1798228 RepID=A0A1I2A8U4_9ACTN|nr:thiolase family protein [Blastococcus sp. DSM 46838]SFE40008.1 Acetyl-CoA acetyltransferase [Blastococcus sp. DSM 46838]
MRDVFVGGVGMTAFGKFPERTVGNLAVEATTGALEDAGLGVPDVETVFYANATAGLMTGQEMVRGQIALRETGLLGKPIVNVENACASASTAANLAWLSVASGQVDVALAVGAEKLSHPDKTRAFTALAAAVDQERLDELKAALYNEQADPAATGDRSFFMDVYADMAKKYMARSGATAEDFAAVAVKSHRHAALNPRAQYRNQVTVEEVLGSRQISGPLTLLMCSPIGDGAAAIAFCSEEIASRLETPKVRVRASSLVSGREGHSSETAAERAAKRAYEVAGLGPEDVDVAEVHDAAAPAELIIYEELGLCGPGEAPKLLASGDTALGGRVPVNTSGGLISKGHPVGATGLAQLVELTEQLRGTLGERQVEGARVALAENGGGYLGPDPAAVCVTILSRD